MLSLFLTVPLYIISLLRKLTAPCFETARGKQSWALEWRKHFLQSPLMLRKELTSSYHAEITWHFKWGMGAWWGPRELKVGELQSIGPCQCDYGNCACQLATTKVSIVSYLIWWETQTLSPWCLHFKWMAFNSLKKTRPEVWDTYPYPKTGEGFTIVSHFNKIGKKGQEPIFKF